MWGGGGRGGFRGGGRWWACADSSPVARVGGGVGLGGLLPVGSVVAFREGFGREEGLGCGGGEGGGVSGVEGGGGPARIVAQSLVLGGGLGWAGCCRLVRWLLLGRALDGKRGWD